MASTKELEDELAKARKDIQALAAMAADKAKTRGNGLASGVETLLQALSEDARASFEAAKAEGAALRGTAEDQIRANPLAATAIAFGVGILFASLMRR
jgi:ElaB/YqjD/DUF883 family membrane-anchored ribosome-binding protein